MVNIEYQLYEQLTKIVNYAKEATGSAIASLFILDNKTKELVARDFSTDLPTKKKEIKLPIYGKGIAPYVARTRNLVNTPDVSQWPRCKGKPIHYTSADKETGIQTIQMVAIPLITAEGNTLGVMEVMNNPLGYSDLDVAILQSLAENATRFITNVREKKEVGVLDSLVEKIIETSKEMSDAAKYLQSICQKPQEQRGFLYSLIHLPCGKLGGDWYYSFKYGKESHHIVGDVEGHELKSTLQAVGCINTARNISETWKIAEKADIKELFAQLNHLPESKGTAFYVGFSDNGKFRYFSAGHNSPYIFDSYGNKKEIESSRVFPFGALNSDEEFRKALKKEKISEGVLKKGDIFFGYTDGLPDLRSKHSNPDNFHQLGSQKLEQILSEKIKKGCSNPNELLSALKKEAVSFAGANLQKNDDWVALCALRLE